MDKDKELALEVLKRVESFVSENIDRLLDANSSIRLTHGNNKEKYLKDYRYNINYSEVTGYTNVFALLSKIKKELE